MSQGGAAQPAAPPTWELPTPLPPDAPPRRPVASAALPARPEPREPPEQTAAASSGLQQPHRPHPPTRKAPGTGRMPTGATVVGQVFMSEPSAAVGQGAAHDAAPAVAKAPGTGRMPPGATVADHVLSTLEALSRLGIEEATAALESVDAMAARRWNTNLSQGGAAQPAAPPTSELPSPLPPDAPEPKPGIPTGAAVVDHVFMSKPKPPPRLDPPPKRQPSAPRTPAPLPVASAAASARTEPPLPVGGAAQPARAKPPPLELLQAGSRVKVNNKQYRVVSVASEPAPYATLAEVTEDHAVWPRLRCAERELQNGQVVWRDSFPKWARPPSRMLFAPKAASSTDATASHMLLFAPNAFDPFLGEAQAPPEAPAQAPASGPLIAFPARSRRPVPEVAESASLSSASRVAPRPAHAGQKTQHLAACWGHLAFRTLNHDALEALCSSAELVARRRRLRHARFIRAILTIVRAWHREQQLF